MSETGNHLPLREPEYAFVRKPPPEVNNSWYYSFQCVFKKIHTDLFLPILEDALNQR